MIHLIIICLLICPSIWQFIDQPIQLSFVLSIYSFTNLVITHPIPPSPPLPPAAPRPPSTQPSVKARGDERHSELDAALLARRKMHARFAYFLCLFYSIFFSAPFISHFIVDFLVFFFCILMTIISIFFPRYFLPSVPFPSITCSVFSSTSIFSHLSYPLILLHYLKLTRRLHKSADLSIKQINKGNDPATITRAKTIPKCAIGNITHH